MRRFIMHIDMDAFFASVEQADRPDLKGQPVIVGGAHRGVVSAASYEARVYGVHSAMPMATAKRLCPRGVFLPVRMSRYAEASRLIMAIIGRYSPQVEKASIDEAYADITGTERLFGPPASLAARLKAEVREETGLTCSVGVAPVKFLAKIASDFKKPDGLTIIEEEGVPAFLARLPVAKIPGVGKRTEETLAALGIRTAGDILKVSPDFWRERFGERGAWLYERARGIDPSVVVPWSEPKSCSAEHTLGEDTEDPEELRTWLLRQAERVGHELRTDGYAGKTVTLKLKFSDFTQITRSRTLPRPINSTMTIFEEAASLLAGVRLPRPVRLIGLGVSNFAPEALQCTLCPDVEDERRKKIDKAIDAVKIKFGDRAVTRAALLDIRKKPQ